MSFLKSRLPESVAETEKVEDEMASKKTSSEDAKSQRKAPFKRKGSTKWDSIVSSVRQRKYSRAIRGIFNATNASRRRFIEFTSQLIRREVKQLLVSEDEFPLCQTADIQNIDKFSWDDTFARLEEDAPLLFAVLKSAVTKSKSEDKLIRANVVNLKPNLGIVLACILHANSPRKAKFLQTLFSVQLKRSGVSRSIITLLAQAGICVGYDSTLTAVANLGSSAAVKLKQLLCSTIEDEINEVTDDECDDCETTSSGVDEQEDSSTDDEKDDDDDDNDDKDDDDDDDDDDNDDDDGDVKVKEEEVDIITTQTWEELGIQMDITKETNKPNPRYSVGKKVHSANSWETADLGDDERNKKFLRLMGAAKKDHHGKIVIGDKDECAVHARSKDNTEHINQELEDQFQHSLDHRITKKHHTGLGFSDTEEKKEETSADNKEETSKDDVEETSKDDVEETSKDDEEETSKDDVEETSKDDVEETSKDDEEETSKDGDSSDENQTKSYSPTKEPGEKGDAEPKSPEKVERKRDSTEISPQPETKKPKMMMSFVKASD